MKKEKIGIFGVGHLGRALNDGLSVAGFETLLNNGSQRRTQSKLAEVGLESQAASLETIAENCSTMFLCFQQNQLTEVSAELDKLLNQDHLVVSCLAQATLGEVTQLLKKSDPMVARLMTTLGVAQNEGVTAFQLTNFASPALHQKVLQLTESISATNSITELKTDKEMELFTIAVGCFPGMLAYFLEQLMVSVDKRDDNKAFVDYQSSLPTLLRSTAGLLEKAGLTRSLRNKVATKGGVTQTMIASIGQAGLSRIVEQSVEAGMQQMQNKKGLVAETN